MNAALLALIVFVIFALGYRFYGRYLSTRIFALADDDPVPSRELEDGVDYSLSLNHDSQIRLWLRERSVLLHKFN